MTASETDLKGPIDKQDEQIDKKSDSRLPEHQRLRT